MNMRTNEAGEVPAWTVEDSKVADEQGWGLFNIDDSGYGEIQRDMEANRFEYDEDAIDFVQRQADAGDVVATKALKIHHRPTPCDAEDEDPGPRAPSSPASSTGHSEAPSAIAQTVLKAAQRMQAANVVIEVDMVGPTIKIDARAVPYITQGGAFTVCGERAGGLISEAQSYADLAETVTLTDAMAFVVDGYLDEFIEPPETVKDAINTSFWRDLHPEIAGIEPDSVVGEAVVALLHDIESVCTRVYAEDGGAVESEIAESMKALAYRQCLVWYFG
ncbi:hypothetical protein [Paraburkholderia sp. J8-2]|uniref:hypothetical protein n=1 Tax=Paraburkholderia sp. J8-2 TaxID=2805440 RepID=UPI002AB76C56|nr:hypothetical protein [Paraburkholderia sp. J8-2]